MATHSQSRNWQPPQARLDGDRLLKDQQDEKRFRDALEASKQLLIEENAKLRAAEEGTAAANVGGVIAPLNAKVDALEKQIMALSNLLTNPQNNGGGGKRMVEKVVTRDGARLINLLMSETILKSGPQFDKDGALYTQGASQIDAATKISGTLVDEHTTAKSLLHLEMVNTGSGAASGPQRAGYTFSASAFKQGFPSLSAHDGEIDTALLTFRQTNGDACNILGNGVIVNGFGAFAEALVYSIEPTAPFDYKHGVHNHYCVVDDRTGTYYGQTAVKEYGVGGYAYYADSTGSAAWEYGIRLGRLGEPQLTQRTSDAALLIHEYDTPATFVSMKITGGVLTFADASGVVVAPATPASTNYTPTATDNASGVAGTNTINGRWVYRSSRVRHVSIKMTVGASGVGTLANVLRLSLPATAVNDTRYVTYWKGWNLTTGKAVRGQVLHNTAYVEIVTDSDSATNTFPIANNDVIYIAGEYETT